MCKIRLKLIEIWIFSSRRQLLSIEEAWNLPISAEMSSRQQQANSNNTQQTRNKYGQVWAHLLISNNSLLIVFKLLRVARKVHHRRTHHPGVRRNVSNRKSLIKNRQTFNKYHNSSSSNNSNRHFISTPSNNNFSSTCNRTLPTYRSSNKTCYNNCRISTG